jgi:adenylate cyclase class 2
MPYGVFLEIEGEKSGIRNMANQLALKWKERIVLNYLEIFEIIRRKEDLPFNDVTFHNFERTRVDIETYLPVLYAG